MTVTVSGVTVTDLACIGEGSAEESGDYWPTRGELLLKEGLDGGGAEDPICAHTGGRVEVEHKTVTTA